MKPSPGNKKLLFALAAVAGLALVFSLLFLSPAKKKAAARQADETAVAGVDLTYLTFNKNNEKKLEVRCEESQKQGDDRLLMKKISATIFKADKLDEDIRIVADSGETREDFNDFHLQGNARISSPSFTLSSRSFNLKNLNTLTTEDEADFKLRTVAGRAGKGLTYLIVNKVLTMGQARGVWTRDGVPYDFQAGVLRVSEQRKLLQLLGAAKIEDAKTVLRADRIVLQFDADFAQVESAAAYGKCFFQASETAPDGRPQRREITARHIKMLYDPQGRLQKITIAGDGEVSLVDGQDVGKIRSAAIEISLDSETQTAQTIRSLTRGTLTHRGKENLQVSGDSFLASYSKDGLLSGIHAQKRCLFETDELNGQAEDIRYDVAEAKIEISGRNSTVSSGKNTFSSNQFLVHTRTRKLVSNQKVKATLIPGKKGVLLGAKPLFVTASGLELGDKGKTTRFSGDVSLFQDAIEMHAGELLFESRANRITSRGNAELKFPDNGDLVALRGNTIAFDPAATRIVIEGEARLQQAPNTLAARRIELLFGRDDKLQNVDAAEKVSFSKGEITGRAQLLHWEYARKTVVFRNAAEITRKDAGTTRGQELRFNLESNEITVSGAGDRSETTIRRERP